jgi:hypothetical protein
VTTSSGFGLRNVDVVLTDNAGAIRRMPTDGSGAYSFIGVAPGDYSIRPVFSGLSFNPPSRNLRALSNTRRIDFFAFAGGFAPAAPLPPEPIADPVIAPPAPVAAPNVSPTPAATARPTATPTARPTATPRPTATVVAAEAPPASNGGGNSSLRLAISGKVATSSGFGLRTIVVTLTDGSGNQRSLQTDSAGSYRFADLPPGTYTITPSYPGLSFLPPSRTGLLSNSNIAGVDFIAQVRR